MFTESHGTSQGTTHRTTGPKVVVNGHVHAHTRVRAHARVNTDKIP